jgi:hypothetical protein
MEDFKTSKSVDMKNLEAVKFAADEEGLSVSHYRACAESAATYDRMAIKKWIQQHYDYKENRIIR